MNILFVCEVDWMRRVVYEVHTLPETLARRGHTVYIVDYEAFWEKERWSDVGRVGTQETLVSRAGIAEIRLVRPGFLKVPVLSRLSAFVPQLVTIERLIREKGIDVVVLYSAPTNGLQTLYAARKHNVPVVFRSIDILHRLCPRILSTPTRIAERMVYSRVDRTLTITPALSDYVVSLGCPQSNVSVLPLEIDVAHNDGGASGEEIRGRWGLDKRDRVVLFVGTLPMFSGLDVFLPSFAKVARNRLDIKLMIVGDGEQRGRLEKLVAELGIGDRVVFTGMQPHDDVPKFIDAADVCISTFPLSETTRDIFPTKVLQYMAGGKAIVSTGLSGLRRMGVGLQEGVLYADAGDEVAGRVIWLLEHDEYRRWLGEQGRRYVCQNHAQERVVDMFEVELETLITGKEA